MSKDEEIELIKSKALGHNPFDVVKCHKCKDKAVRWSSELVELPIVGEVSYCKKCAQALEGS